MLSKGQKTELEIFACNIRKQAIKSMACAGRGHIGGAMSMADTLAVLYGKQMRIDPVNPKWEDRDRFVLSKGHAGPSLYATLALKGYFPLEDLYTLNQGGTPIPSHPDRNKTKGIDFSSGSLGNGLSIACGSALGARVFGRDYYTYCMVGDGECDEGEIWEAALFAAHQKISNLVAFIDKNGQQIDGHTNEICNLGDIGKKFEDFGWYVQQIDGHDVEAIDGAVENAKAQHERPAVIVLCTVKGKGCRMAEKAGMCHHMSVSQENCDAEWALLDKRIAELQERREDVQNG
jgi:transketolase